MLSPRGRWLEDLGMAGHEGRPGTKVNNCSLPKCMEAQPLPSSSAPVKLLNSAVQEKERTDHRPGAASQQRSNPASGYYVLCDHVQVTASLWAAAPSL